MVSFFGFKFGADKKKKHDKASSQKGSPKQPDLLDQPFDGYGPGSRPGTGHAMKPPRGPYGVSGPSSSMQDLTSHTRSIPSFSSLRPVSSRKGLGHNHQRKGSDASLVPPPSFGLGLRQRASSLSRTSSEGTNSLSPRPSTSGGLVRLDRPDSEHTSIPSVPSMPSSPSTARSSLNPSIPPQPSQAPPPPPSTTTLTAPAMSPITASNPKSPLGQFQLHLDLSDDNEPFMPEKSQEEIGKAMGLTGLPPRKDSLPGSRSQSPARRVPLESQDVAAPRSPPRSRRESARKTSGIAPASRASAASSIYSIPSVRYSAASRPEGSARDSRTSSNYGGRPHTGHQYKISLSTQNEEDAEYRERLSRSTKYASSEHPEIDLSKIPSPTKTEASPLLIPPPESPPKGKPFMRLPSLHLDKTSLIPSPLQSPVVKDQASPPITTDTDDLEEKPLPSPHDEPALAPSSPLDKGMPPLPSPMRMHPPCPPKKPHPINTGFDQQPPGSFAQHQAPNPALDISGLQRNDSDNSTSYSPSKEGFWTSKKGKKEDKQRKKEDRKRRKASKSGKIVISAPIPLQVPEAAAAAPPLPSPILPGFNGNIKIVPSPPRTGSPAIPGALSSIDTDLTISSAMDSPVTIRAMSPSEENTQPPRSPGLAPYTSPVLGSAFSYNGRFPDSNMLLPAPPPGTPDLEGPRKAPQPPSVTSSPTIDSPHTLQEGRFTSMVQPDTIEPEVTPDLEGSRKAPNPPGLTSMGDEADRADPESPARLGTPMIVQTPPVLLSTAGGLKFRERVASRREGSEELESPNSKEIARSKYTPAPLSPSPKSPAIWAQEFSQDSDVADKDEQALVEDRDQQDMGQVPREVATPAPSQSQSGTTTYFQTPLLIQDGLPTSDETPNTERSSATDHPRLDIHLPHMSPAFGGGPTRPDDPFTEQQAGNRVTRPSLDSPEWRSFKNSPGQQEVNNRQVNDQDLGASLPLMSGQRSFDANGDMYNDNIGAGHSEPEPLGSGVRLERELQGSRGPGVHNAIPEHGLYEPHHLDHSEQYGQRPQNAMEPPMEGQYYDDRSSYGQPMQQPFGQGYMDGPGEGYRPHSEQYGPPQTGYDGYEYEGAPTYHDRGFDNNHDSGHYDQPYQGMHGDEGDPRMAFQAGGNQGAMLDSYGTGYNHVGYSTNGYGNPSPNGRNPAPIVPPQRTFKAFTPGVLVPDDEEVSSLVSTPLNLSLKFSPSKSGEGDEFPFPEEQQHQQHQQPLSRQTSIIYGAKWSTLQSPSIQKENFSLPAVSGGVARCAPTPPLSLSTNRSPEPGETRVEPSATQTWPTPSATPEYGQRSEANEQDREDSLEICREDFAASPTDDSDIVVPSSAGADVVEETETETMTVQPKTVISPHANDFPPSVGVVRNQPLTYPTSDTTYPVQDQDSPNESEFSFIAAPALANNGSPETALVTPTTSDPSVTPTVRTFGTLTSDDTIGDSPPTSSVRGSLLVSDAYGNMYDRYSYGASSSLHSSFIDNYVHSWNGDLDDEYKERYPEFFNRGGQSPQFLGVADGGDEASLRSNSVIGLGSPIKKVATNSTRDQDNYDNYENDGQDSNVSANGSDGGRNGGYGSDSSGMAGSARGYDTKSNTILDLSTDANWPLPAPPPPPASMSVSPLLPAILAELPPPQPAAVSRPTSPDSPIDLPLQHPPAPVMSPPPQFLQQMPMPSPSMLPTSYSAPISDHPPPPPPKAPTPPPPPPPLGHFSQERSMMSPSIPQIPLPDSTPASPHPHTHHTLPPLDTYTPPQPPNTHLSPHSPINAPPQPFTNAPSSRPTTPSSPRQPPSSGLIGSSPAPSLFPQIPYYPMGPSPISATPMPREKRRPPPLDFGTGGNSTNGNGNTLAAGGGASKWTRVGTPVVRSPLVQSHSAAVTGRAGGDDGFF